VLAIFMDVDVFTAFSVFVIPPQPGVLIFAGFTVAHDHLDGDDGRIRFGSGRKHFGRYDSRQRPGRNIGHYNWVHTPQHTRGQLRTKSLTGQHSLNHTPNCIRDQSLQRDLDPIRDHILDQRLQRTRERICGSKSRVTGCAIRFLPVIAA